MSSGTTASGLSLEGLTLRLGHRTLLQDIDLQVPVGQVVALLGPSGCGKTSLLRMVAGLLAPSAGVIRIGGDVVADGHQQWPPERRGLGMVFQDYALWPHLSVLGNVMFPLRMRRLARPEARCRALEALSQVGLAELADRRPARLSGGQQQRVALARALVARPRLVLFDEPLSNLDHDLRASLCGEIGSLLRSHRTTALYVTHDPQEADTIADRIVHLHDGALVTDRLPRRLAA